MINGFEEETQPLTDYEKDTLLPIMVKGLSKKVGNELAITNKVMVSVMRTAGYKISEARVRKLINHIRRNDLVPLLIASSKGYYIENDDEKVREYIESLHQRASAIYAVGRSVQRQYNDNFFTNQLKLFI
jgi:hypothetical protein